MTALAERQPLNLSLPECAPGTFCVPITLHNDTSILDICIHCCRVGQWLQVVSLPGQETAK